MGSALDARGIKSSPDNLVGHVEGIIENVDGVPLITTIRVRYTCKIPNGKRAEPSARSACMRRAARPARASAGSCQAFGWFRAA